MNNILIFVRVSQDDASDELIARFDVFFVE